MKKKNLEHLLEGAHCSNGVDLIYKSTIKKDQVGKDYKSYAGFCLVEDNNCPYYQSVGNQHVCNNRFELHYENPVKYHKRK